MGILPTEITLKKIDPDRQIVCLYGPPKIGKSTTASRIKGGLFLATEAGLNALDTHQVNCQSWETLERAIDELSRGKHTFTTIIIDTVDQAHKLCMDHVCKMMKVEHPTAARDPRPVWGRINYEFERIITKLIRTGLGVWFLSHSKEEVLDEGNGRKRVIRPALTGRSRDLITGQSDIIMFAGVNNAGTRQLWCDETPIIMAGCRGAVLPPTLPMSYREFAAALQEGSKPKKSAKVDSKESTK